MRNEISCFLGAALLVAAACSSDSGPSAGSGVSMGSGSGAVTTGATSSGFTGTGSIVGMSGDTGTGTGSATGASSGMTGSGTSSGAASGTGSTTGSVASGTSGGTGATSGVSSGASSSGATAGTHRHGMSMGCGKAPGAVGGQRAMVPKCPAGCSAMMGNCARDCIAPEFAPGGPNAGGRDFTNRPYSIQLPGGYQQTTAYPVFLGGGGCGSGGGGYTPPGVNGIRVSLAILGGNGYPDSACFADGGVACSAINTEASLSVCVNSPEVPYVRAILNYLETNFCVDLDKEFIGGSSSGAWESYTVGCGDADQLRGIAPNAGGLRAHRWACAGPQAALMIANSGDNQNQVVTGGLEPHLDSLGSAAARDELLKRNGCQTTDKGVMYSAAYPACLKYTTCPAAYPVVWCELNGGHTNSQQGGVDYASAIWPFFMALPPAP